MQFLDSQSTSVAKSIGNQQHRTSQRPEAVQVSDASKKKKKKKGDVTTVETSSNTGNDVSDLLDEQLDSTKRASLVWKYATRFEGSNFAVCKLCDGEKRISTNSGSTSTLREHLISKHGKTELMIHGKRKNNVKTMSSTRKEELNQLAFPGEMNILEG